MICQYNACKYDICTDCNKEIRNCPFCRVDDSDASEDDDSDYEIDVKMEDLEVVLIEFN